MKVRPSNYPGKYKLIRRQGKFYVVPKDEVNE